MFRLLKNDIIQSYISLHIGFKAVDSEYEYALRLQPVKPLNIVTSFCGPMNNC